MQVLFGLFVQIIVIQHLQIIYGCACAFCFINPSTLRLMSLVKPIKLSCPGWWNWRDNLPVNRWLLMWVVNSWRTTSWTRRTAQIRVWPSWTRPPSAPSLCRWVSCIPHVHVKPRQLKRGATSPFVFVRRSQSGAYSRESWGRAPRLKTLHIQRWVWTTASIFKAPVTTQNARVFFQLVRCFPDEGWEACRKQRGLFCPRTLSVCPPRQTSEEGSSEHLFANRGHFQRHSQPRERGQRRITPLSQTGIEGEKKQKKKHTLHRIYFFMQPVYKTQIV